MIKILCVGKIKESYLDDLINDYKKRIGKYIKIEIIELKDDVNYDKEISNLIKNIKTSDYNIGLDLKGKMYSSLEFADKIDKILPQNSNITFIIGGSLGLNDEVRSLCNELISFSQMTFPHGLFRGILLEQIYRTCKINNHEMYHKWGCMKVNDVRNMKVALTHAGKFHADDVFGAAFLKIINPKLEIIRSNVVPADFDGLVFDIGMGEFDHHMADNEVRKNDIPYAAFGKLWREFAPSLYGKYVYESIDRKLIQDLDLADNTGSYNALAIAIDVFNPEDVKNSDNEFFEAVEFAKKILIKMIDKQKRCEKDLVKVKKYYEEAKDKRIIVLDEPLFYKDYLPFTEAVYVVYPSNRGGFAAQGVTINPDTNELKKDFPETWVKNLPPYLRFCHTSRFLIAADSFEEIMHATREALKWLVMIGMKS